MKRQTAALVATTALAAVLAGPLAAQSQGDWTLGVGLGWVNPKSNNGTLAGAKAEVGDNIRPTFTAEYFFRDNWGIEILAATPFEHNVFLGGSYAAKVKQLPPTVSVNYHIPTQTAFKPFVGLGLNYTTFFDESMAGGGKLSLDDSWGVAVHAGVDYQITDRGAMRFDLRWIDINTDASLNGVNIGSADINPLVVGVSYVHRF
ncbi:OmpW/AlkL family protein [Pseudodonghicola xiamenensis]|uniref:Outer membrane protein n=1 Tax=Pseudodonghicola xiamenensis TaxID=337702 RepID=A0A8J3H498_9RHOB|nr:OmpW family outer membrane protein [Pseudodonghicola xiamenensis]GHG79263.1 outer membrane protein [Pseudodonghicola xiamenensis]